MPYGYDWRQTQQLSSSGTGNVQTFTPDDRNATAALVSVETNDARVTVDGSTPSAANGHIVYKGANPLLLLLGSDVVKVAAATAGPSLVNVTWGY